MHRIKIANQCRLILRIKFKKSNFDSSKDYFKILGVPKNATEAQIKQQYYKLALKYHPDHHKGSEQQIKLINQAYSVLSDYTTRKQYQNSRPSSDSNFGWQAYNQNRNQNYEQNQRGDPYHSYQNRQGWENQKERSYQRNAYNWSQSRGFGPEYENPHEYYSRYRQYAQEGHRQFMRKQKEKYEKQQETDEQRLTANEYYKLKKLLQSSFIAGFFISLVFLIPQMLVGPYGPENKNSYKIKQTNKYAYPYQQPDPMEYKNPRYSQTPQSNYNL